MAKKETKPQDCQVCACIGCSEGNCCNHEGRRDVWEQLWSATDHAGALQSIFERKQADLSDVAATLNVALRSRYLEWEDRSSILAVASMALSKTIELSQYENAQVYNDPKCVACQCTLCRKRSEDLNKRMSHQWVSVEHINSCCGHKEMSTHNDDLPF